MRQIEGSSGNLPPINTDRRKLLLSGAISLAALAILPDLSSFVEKEPSGLQPNNSVCLSNFSVVPEKLYSHSNKEMISMTIDFGEMFNLSSPSFLNLNPFKKGDIYGYGMGIKEALGRGQEVFLVIETPGKESKGVTLQNWEQYVMAISKRWRGATFIIGNEVNHYIDNPWNAPDKYAELYLAAAKTIRNTSPKSKILLYGEAYTGHQEILKDVINSLSRQFSGLSLPIDGLAFHFYDRASLLPGKIKEYQKFAKEHNLSQDLYLTEMGKPEKELLSEEELSWAVTQITATASALIGEGKIKMACWHTAFQCPDPYGHNLAKLDWFGYLAKSKPFDQFYLVNRLLHHDVRFVQHGNGLITVSGKNSQGKETVISWNTRCEGNPIEGMPIIVTKR